MQDYDFDLFVIGGGSGGVRAARLAGALGKKVGLAEGYRLGGTCVIRGCVPKKLMFYASEYKQYIDESRNFGWSFGQCQFHWREFLAKRNQELNRLEGLYRQGLIDNNVVIFSSYAKFLDAHTILLSENGQKITAKKIIIATGGRPLLPKDVEGIEYALTSNEVLDLKTLPKSMVIVGGGYISLEFACILHNLGVDITLICRISRIARHFDSEVALFLQKILIEKGIKLYTNSLVTKIINKNLKAESSQNLDIILANGDILQAESICYAIGRQPATDDLGMEKAGLFSDKKGAVLTNGYKQTNQKHIYAIGDAASGGIQLTPVAIHEAMCVIDSLYHKKPTLPDYELVATAIFSQPEVGTVGLTEEECVERYQDVDVYRAEFRSLRATISDNKEKVLIKILVDQKTDIVRGVHFVGPHAAEIIQLLAIALKSQLTKKAFDKTMAVHPTASEEFVTMYQPTYSYRHGKRLAIKN